MVCSHKCSVLPAGKDRVSVTVLIISGTGVSWWCYMETKQDPSGESF